MRPPATRRRSTCCICSARACGTAAAAGSVDAPPPAAWCRERAAQASTSAASTEATLADCLTLLRGPGDERRLVGLLLVTKFLTAESDSTLQARVPPIPLLSRALRRHAGNCACSGLNACGCSKEVLAHRHTGTSHPTSPLMPALPLRRLSPAQSGATSLHGCCMRPPPAPAWRAPRG